MTVDDVFQSPAIFLGHEVNIRGRLISDLATILQSPTPAACQQQIIVKHPRIQERLLEVVPCHVDGDALYSDDSQVTGRLALEEDHFVLYASSVQILRSGEAPYIVELAT